MQKGTAALIALIAVLSLLALFGVAFFALSQLNKVSLSGNAPISTPKPVYRNQQLGLEFEYPGEDFEIKDDSEEEFNKRGNGNYRKNFTGYVRYEPGKFFGAIAVLDQTKSFDANPLSIWVFDNPDNLTVESWFDKYWYYPFIWGVFDSRSKGHITPDSEATISGKLAKSKIVTYQGGKPKFVYISNNQKMYLFRVIGKMGETILSSVAFSK